MKNETTLVLIRHGETEWNRTGRYQGHADSPLTPRGLAQARAVAQVLNDETFDAFYSSDLGRARRTATIIADKLGRRFLTDSRLREQHYGLMQGHDGKTARELDPEFFESLARGDADYTPKGGESRKQRHERAIAALSDIAGRHQGEMVLIITHGGIVDSIFRETLGIPFENPRRYSLYNTALNRFSFFEGSWTLRLWGEISHLENAGATDAGNSFTAA
ncbi:MAG: histidine phosphatase family protein [Spirochaetes bacterium]|nr:MAG: histidine phosphatase family protein [Spirochaetota bacterium]RKX97514.1 MAG: histidine phosphatase family protein [Spirochaetota bacterium]